MVTKKYSLNSKAAGNFKQNNFISALAVTLENFFTHQQHSFLTCRVNCHTQSMNWMKTGERSASVWFLSPWPMRLKTKQKNRGDQWCNWTGTFGDFRPSTWKFVYQLEAVTEAQPLLLEQHLETADGAVVSVQHEHGQGRELARAVPTVAAVHHHRGFPGLHLVCNPQCSCHDQLQTHTSLSISLCYFSSSLYIFHSIVFFILLVLQFLVQEYPVGFIKFYRILSYIQQLSQQAENPHSSPSPQSQ